MKFKCRFSLALASSLLSAGTAAARPLFVHNPSLEAMIARSSSVFRGSVSNYSQTVVSPPRTNFVRDVTTGEFTGIHSRDILSKNHGWK